MKKLFALSMLAASLATGCRSHEDPQPQPAGPKQAAIVNENFDYYATSTTPAASVANALLADKPFGQLVPEHLTLTLPVLSPANQVVSKVDLVLPASRQKFGLVGTYQLASLPNASVGDVTLNYARPSNGTSLLSNYYGSNNNQVAGTLTITYYDAGNRIISGNYSARLPNVRDPFSYQQPGTPSDARRAGDLHLSGTFIELPL